MPPESRCHDDDFKVVGVIRNGFAYPKLSPPINTSISGRANRTNKSICASGLSVKRPDIFAVGSPHLCHKTMGNLESQWQKLPANSVSASSDGTDVKAVGTIILISTSAKTQTTRTDVSLKALGTKQ